MKSTFTKHSSREDSLARLVKRQQGVVLTAISDVHKSLGEARHRPDDRTFLETLQAAILGEGKAGIGLVHESALPIADAHRGIAFAEALVRARLADGSALSPQKLFNGVRALGIGVPFRNFLMLKQLEDSAANPQRRTSINISASDMDPGQHESRNFIWTLRSALNILKKQGATMPVLEATEETLWTSSRIEQLADAAAGVGASIAIDDYGTGYNRLDVLQNFASSRLPLKKLLVKVGVDTDGKTLAFRDETVGSLDEVFRVSPKLPIVLEKVQSDEGVATVLAALPDRLRGSIALAQDRSFTAGPGRVPAETADSLIAKLRARRADPGMPRLA